MNDNKEQGTAVKSELTVKTQGGVAKPRPQNK